VKRSKPLKRDTTAAREFQQRGRGGLQRKPPQPADPSGGEGMASQQQRRVVAEVWQQATSLPAAPPTPKQGRPPRSGKTNRKGRSSWGRAARARPCAMCGGNVGLQGHHIIPLQVLKDEGVPNELWYDQRNMLPLCNEPSPRRCHQRHELRVVPVPLRVVELHAPQAREFARQVGLEYRLDNIYPASG
jgi:hypothetical protein